MAGGGDLWQPFDRRHPEATGRGAHALVIGVSAYNCLPPPGGDPSQTPWQLLELDSAATAALRFAEWLNERYQSGEDAPLQSLRVLLSPSDWDGGAGRGTERERLRKRLGDAPAADRANVVAAVRAWGLDLQRNAGSTAVLYLAGHGVVRSVDVKKTEERALLLQDIPSQVDLDSSVNVTSILGTLSYCQLDASYAFLDTCSDWLSVSGNYAGRGIELGLDDELTAGLLLGESRRGDHRFLASSPRGGKAKGHWKVGSIFVDRLLYELRDGVIRTADGTWAVIPEELGSRLLKWAEDQPLDFFTEMRKCRELRFQLPERPPTGTMTVTLVPSDRASRYTLDKVDEDFAASYPEFRSVPFDPHPFEREVEPGMHCLRLTGGREPQYRRRTVEVYRPQNYEFAEDAP